jgi:transposase
LFYRWQKEFFENGSSTFEKDGRSQVERENAALKTKLAKKDSVIAELMEDFVLRKEIGAVWLVAYRLGMN